MRTLAPLLGAALLMTACGGDDDDTGAQETGTVTEAETEAQTDTEEPTDDETPTEEETDDSEASGGDLTPIRITSLGLCEEVPIYWAIEKGIFEANGLEAELVQSGGGAAAVAAIVSDSADFAFSNPITAMLSYAQGFPLKVVAPLYESPKPPDPIAAVIAVGVDSGIEGPTDLVGKKVGVNEVGGINQIIISAWINENGGNAEDVNFVALPFSELGTAVAEGRVDASQTTAGTAAQLESEGTARILGSAFRELRDGNILYTNYIVTEDFIANNPGAAEAYQASLAEAVEAVEDPANEEERNRVAGDNCFLDAETYAQVPKQDYVSAIDMETYSYMGQLLVDQGYVSELPDLEQLVAPFARS